MYGGYYGGWLPGTYLTGEIPLDVYENKNHRPYMDIKDWAKDKWGEEAERDKQLGSIYMSAKMMKYHPLMTKELRKTYSLLAAAAMKAMTPEYKYLIKKRFNSTNTAIKALREEQKLAKLKYGPVKKRGIYGKINFWNRLIDTNIEDEGVPMLLSSYEPGRLMANPNYKPSGTLGTARAYQEYKDKLAERREKMRQKMLLLKDSERDWYRQRARLWTKGRKRARDAIKAYKEQLAASAAPIELAAFNPTKSLGEVYEGAFNAEIAADPSFYKDKDLRADIVKEMAKDVHEPWFKQAYKMYAKGKRFADQIPGREKYAPLTLKTRNQPYRLADLAHSTTADPNRLLTQKMRQAGTTLDTFKYMIPRNREEYLAKHPDAVLPPPPPPKTQAAQIANVALLPTNRPIGNIAPATGLPPISPEPSQIPATQASQTTPSNAPTQPPSTYEEEDEEMDPTEDITANGWGWGWY